MYKKSLIILSVFLAILCVSSLSFATANDVKNAINAGTNTVVDGVDRLGTSVRNGIGNMENGIEGALNMNNTDNLQTAQSSISTGTNYNATRTATAGTTGTTNMWVWVIVAIAAVAVIGLVWYYATTNDEH